MGAIKTPGSYGGPQENDTAAVAALTTTALAGAPAHREGSYRCFATLVNTVLSDYGWAGLFDLACTCAGIAHDGLDPGSREQLGYRPYEVVPDGQRADDPGARAWAKFATARLAANPTGARAVFDALQPDQRWWVGPSEAMAEFLIEAWVAAWRRQAGGELELLITPGDRWPPVCDFCCVDTASGMYRCASGDLVLNNARATMGALRVRLSDVRFWYVCAACTPLVDARPPDWDRVWERHRRERPHARREQVMVLFDLFEQLREDRHPMVLPKNPPS